METQDDEAHAIATMIPMLKRLEMAYHLFLKESFPKLTVLRPLVMEDFYVTNGWEEFSDDSDYDDQGELEELERIYETGDV
ncbi:hypothetical protein OIU85_008812 [Salix viminalis]|uniref:Uncharacterized protein n=1 Tax=Salix viminalis TaxID=40686 RepID=A0A9Q0SHR7_SALVM|nr:hypothetical protein OIU85_008812 [Salix viminalis]